MHQISLRNCELLHKWLCLCVMFNNKYATTATTATTVSWWSLKILHYADNNRRGSHKQCGLNCTIQISSGLRIMKTQITTKKQNIIYYCKRLFKVFKWLKAMEKTMRNIWEMIERIEMINFKCFAEVKRINNITTKPK